MSIVSSNERVETDIGSEAGRHYGLALAVISAAQLMVVLDMTIVNIALPSMQTSLHFSATNLQWVINAYTLAFGGLLMLGGRLGDLLGRRRMFIAGVALFTAASLAGGFATGQTWLIVMRVIQGIGGAIASPTALSLITTTFPEGRRRNTAMGVYAAMSGSGTAIGLLAGGLLTQYASWRWVLFVNVPIGALVLLLATRTLPESTRARGRFDLPGALSVTLGVSLLVYGLTRAPSDGWASATTIACLAAGGVLLALFGVIETVSRYALMPLRVLASRDRSGSYLVSLCVGAAMMGMFYFLTLFVQQQLGYSPIRAGVAFLPISVAIVVAAGLASRLVARLGARSLIYVGLALAVGGMFWLSRINEHSTYATGLLAPSLILAVGLGLMFVPLTLTAVAGVRDSDQGVASALLNSGQQIGGSLGLAVLVTVATTVTTNKIHDYVSSVAAHAHLPASAAAHSGGGELPAAVQNHALVSGYSTGFVVAAGIALLSLVVAVIMIRVSRADQPTGAPGMP